MGDGEWGMRMEIGWESDDGWQRGLAARFDWMMTGR